MHFIATVTSKYAICVAGKYNGKDIISRNTEKTRDQNFCEIRKRIKKRLCFKKLYYSKFVTNMLYV